MNPAKESSHAGGGSSRGSLFRVKSLDSILQDAERPEFQLRRALGPVQLTLMGIGAIIGAGIFATIGQAAAGDQVRLGAGPGLVLSFVITAVVCGFTAVCYAELASMVPISGSAYTYSYATLGELFAWIIGWDLIIEYAVGNTAVGISWANYFKTLLKETIPGGWGIIIPDWLSLDYRTVFQMAEKDPAKYQEIIQSAPHLFGYPIIVNLVAGFIILAITAIVIWGVRESAVFNALMVTIKLVVLAFFVVVGLAWVRPENWRPFAPNGWAGISAGAAIVFFAYIGFDAISTVAEETRTPQRNLPIGIIASLVICTVVYVAVAVVFTGLISYTDLQGKIGTEGAEPLTMALQHAMPESAWAVGIVAFGSVVAHTAVLLVFQVGQTRLFFAMARDGLLPRAFSRVHPRFRTPHLSALLTGLFVALVAAFASIDEMVDLTNIGTLFAFILVCAGVIVLRLKEPDRPRPFRVPGGPLIPLLGILSCLYLIYFLPSTSWLRFAAWLNLGLVVFVVYGSVHSRLTGRQLSSQPAEHDLRTAYVGSLLALGGTVCLMALRGVEIWFEQVKQYEAARPAETFFSAARAGLVHLGSLDSWLEASWFVMIPLGVHVLVLVPFIWIRSLRGGIRQGGDAGKRTQARTLLFSGALAVFSLAYLGLVWRNW